MVPGCGTPSTSGGLLAPTTGPAALPTTAPRTGAIWFYSTCPTPTRCDALADAQPGGSQGRPAVHAAPRPDKPTAPAERPTGPHLQPPAASRSAPDTSVALRERRESDRARPHRRRRPVRPGPESTPRPSTGPLGAARRRRTLLGRPARAGDAPPADPARLAGLESQRSHGALSPVTAPWSTAPPVFVLAGDVGTGKTALAETIGRPQSPPTCAVPVSLYRLSLTARGRAAVGEMTTLSPPRSRTVVRRPARRSATAGRCSAFILVIDEADALAQSRENGQMHHEDRAGVNALIRASTTCATSGSRCSSCGHQPPGRARPRCPPPRGPRVRVPAPRRRPAPRPPRGGARRRRPGGLPRSTALAEATGPCEGRYHGHTYSDLPPTGHPRDRPGRVPPRCLHRPARAAILVAQSIEPTRPFGRDE